VFPGKVTSHLTIKLDTHTQVKVIYKLPHTAQYRKPQVKSYVTEEANEGRGLFDLAVDRIDRVLLLLTRENSFGLGSGGTGLSDSHIFITCSRCSQKYIGKT
jgi:hypothetical protein